MHNYFRPLFLVRLFYFSMNDQLINSPSKRTPENYNKTRFNLGISSRSPTSMEIFLRPPGGSITVSVHSLNKAVLLKGSGTKIENTGASLDFGQ